MKKLLLLLFLIPNLVMGELEFYIYKEYRLLMDKPSETVSEKEQSLMRLVSINISAMGDAYMWVDSESQIHKIKPLFCFSGPHLFLIDYLRIIDEELLLQPKHVELESSIAFVLLKGLERTFPCN